MLSIILILNIYFVDDFYYIYIQNVVENEIEKINIDDLQKIDVIDDLQNKTGFRILIYGNVVDNKLAPKELIPNKTTIDHLLRNVDEVNELYFEIYSPKEINESQLFFVMELEDGSIFTMYRNIGFVNETRTLFLIFLSVITLIVYLVSIIVIYIVTDKITNPVIELNNVAKKISQLDFDERVESVRNDEIGELIDSVNLMAGSLSKNLEELKETNLKLEQELSKEKNLESMRRRFVSDVSHELRNPISMIMAYSEGLKMRIPKNQEAYDNYYDVIYEEGNKMNQLISDLLDLSSYQAGTFTIKKEVFDFGDLVKNSLEHLEYLIYEKKINPLINIQEDCMINADRLRIDQVLTNLLVNALKHVNLEGSLLVRLENVENYAKLTISNSGKLIPEDELDNIWNSFYQLDTDSKGHGLGLAIARSIIDMHDSTIRAYVEDGLNCFEVSLKIVDEI